LSLLIILFRW